MRNRRSLGILGGAALLVLGTIGCGGSDSFSGATSQLLSGQIPGAGSSNSALMTGNGTPGVGLGTATGPDTLITVTFSDGRSFSTTLPFGETRFTIPVSGINGLSVLITARQGATDIFESLVTGLGSALTVDIGNVDIETTLLTHALRLRAQARNLGADNGQLVRDATRIPLGGGLLDPAAFLAAMKADPAFQAQLTALKAAVNGGTFGCTLFEINHGTCADALFTTVAGVLNTRGAALEVPVGTPPGGGPGPGGGGTPSTVAKLISINLAATGNVGGSSGPPAISEDGQRVLFGSRSGAALVNPFNLGAFDFCTFMRDLGTNTTSIVSIDPAGTQVAATLSAISDDGGFVAFVAGAGSNSQVMVRNISGAARHGLAAGTTRLVSKDAGGTAIANAFANGVALSQDGRYLVFVLTGTGILLGQQGGDVIRYDVLSDSYALANTDSAATPFLAVANRADISDDGNIIAMERRAGGSNQIYVKNMTSNVLQLASRSDLAGITPGPGTSIRPSLAGNGSMVAFESDVAFDAVNDTNGQRDIYFFRIAMPVIPELLSTDGAGVVGDSLSVFPGVDDSGTYIVFESQASNLDTMTASPIVAGNGQVYVKNRLSGAIAINSLDGAGNPGANANNIGNSFTPVISGNGNFIAFETFATNLVALDTNIDRDHLHYPRLLP